MSGNAGVEVPADWRGCHPLVPQTKRALEKAKPDETLLLWSRAEGILSVCVSRQITALGRKLYSTLLITLN
jgi:hypothetical protein